MTSSKGITSVCPNQQLYLFTTLQPVTSDSQGPLLQISHPSNGVVSGCLCLVWWILTSGTKTLSFHSIYWSTPARTRKKRMQGFVRPNKTSQEATAIKQKFFNLSRNKSKNNFSSQNLLCSHVPAWLSKPPKLSSLAAMPPICAWGQDHFNISISSCLDDRKKYFLLLLDNRQRFGGDTRSHLEKAQRSCSIIFLEYKGTSLIRIPPPP